MAEAITKLPIKTDERKPTSGVRPWRPFESLRREIDRLFDDFDGGWGMPLARSLFEVPAFWQREATLAAAPVVDVAETDKAYELQIVAAQTELDNFGIADPKTFYAKLQMAG